MPLDPAASFRSRHFNQQAYILIASLFVRFSCLECFWIWVHRVVFSYFPMFRFIIFSIIILNGLFVDSGWILASSFVYTRYLFVGRSLGPFCENKHRARTGALLVGFCQLWKKITSLFPTSCLHHSMMSVCIDIDAILVFLWHHFLCSFAINLFMICWCNCYPSGSSADPPF